MHTADPYLLSISLESSPLGIPEAARRVAGFAARRGLGAQGCFEVQVVVTEALNNLFEHAGCLPTDPLVGIHCGERTGTLEIRIVDHGPAFVPPVQAKIPATQAEHGRGWPIISRWTDRIDYRVFPQHNELTLYRRLA
jgi:anti-sigma regulatory factor (Ser/Thr protein kinase)